jgi:electron transfer flavoprotein alpha subunit
MLKARISMLNRVLARSYATAASPHALVFLEHRQGDLDSASLSALTAASQLGGHVTGLIVGSPEEMPSVVEKAKRYTFKLPRICR